MSDEKMDAMLAKLRELRKRTEASIKKMQKLNQAEEEKLKKEIADYRALYGRRAR